MKVTVESKEVQKIDWSKAQLVVYDELVIQVSTNQAERYDDDCFCGQDIQSGVFAEDWRKSSFKPFTGKITIEQ